MPEISRNIQEVYVVSDPTSFSIAVDATASATGAASAIAPALASVTGKTNYITGFEVTGGGATGASMITITVTGTLGGTLNYAYGVVAGVTLGSPNLVVEFTRPIPASAVSTAITVNVPSFGTGNTLSAAVVHGFSV